MDEIRVGIYGVGHRGIHWLRILDRLDGYRITAIGDMFPQLHERALGELNDSSGVAVHTAYEDMLADGNVDAIALCVRCEEQGAMAAMAMEAGKHVNSEVPASHTMEDCWRIVAAQERTGLVYLLGEQVRHSGFITAWRDLVRSGKLGHVGYVEGEYMSRKDTRRYWRDFETAEFVDLKDLHKVPWAQKTWTHDMPPIHYLCHDLSAMLSILDDRVVRVTAMSTQADGYAHDEIVRPDIQVALLHTAKDTIMRMACGWTIGRSRQTRGHRYQMIASHGTLETGPTLEELPMMYLAESQMHEVSRVEWRIERDDAPEEAARLADIPSTVAGQRSTGYSEPSMDYFVHAEFRDAILNGKQPEFDVYQAMDTAAPAILAADSIEQGSKPIDVPDFRPSESRAAGQMPEEYR